LPRRLAAVVEDDQRRNAADAIAAGDVGGGFGVELGQPHSRLEFTGGARELRRHHATWPTPRGPEIDDDWNVAPAGMAVEIGRG